jgi:hypothetical protein
MELLDVVQAPALVVLADLLVLLLLLELVVALAAGLADGGLGVLGLIVAFLTISFRRSSVSGGTGMRMILPSDEGFNPRSDFMIARSMAELWLGS